MTFGTVYQGEMLLVKIEDYIMAILGEGPTDSRYAAILCPCKECQKISQYTSAINSLNDSLGQSARRRTSMPLDILLK